MKHLTEHLNEAIKTTAKNIKSGVEDMCKKEKLFNISTNELIIDDKINDWYDVSGEINHSEKEIVFIIMTKSGQSFTITLHGNKKTFTQFTITDVDAVEN